MALDLEARIFDFQFVQHVEETLFVGLFLGLDGQSLHRLREFERLEVDVILIVRVVQYTVELDFLDFGDSTNVAGDQLVDLDVFLAEQSIEVTDFERALGIANEKL